jgi:lysophospholipase L1-like esterase
LGLIGLALVLCASGYLFWTYHPSVGSGRVGPSVPRESFEKPWNTNTVWLVGLGDSITAGFGARKGYSYFDRLIANPSDEFPEMRGINLKQVFPALVWTNLSVSGSTSGEVLASQLPRLAEVPTNVMGLIVITTGGNDLIHNYGRTTPREQAMYGATYQEAEPWVRQFAQRMENSILALNARFPAGCHVFLANIYDPSDGAGDIEKAGLPAWPDGLRILGAYNAVIADLSAKHTNVHLVGVHKLFLGHGIHSAQFWSAHYHRDDPHYWYYTNLEDPNERGYDAIRRQFLNEIIRFAPALK